MNRSYLARVFGIRGVASDVLGVSEAIGSILLLGISVTLAGAIAIWTQTIEDKESGTYVDLRSEVQGNSVLISHRGGDYLDGANTFVHVRNSDGTTAYYDSYSALTMPSDRTWGPGEELSLDLTMVTSEFQVIVTTIEDSGNPIEVMSIDMTKVTVGPSLPDLAITMVQIRDMSGNIISGGIFEEGAYQIYVRIDNFGADLSTSYLSPDLIALTVSNFQIQDPNDNMLLTSLAVHHWTNPPGTEVLGPSVGMLRENDHMEIIFTWSAYQSDPRTLGTHTLKIKVLPDPNGELNYRNNYVDRNVKVNKEITPQVINGPDPGIYEIEFSDDAPHSGETITVTVIVQNSGDEPLMIGDGVDLIVSTWAPVRMVHVNDDPPALPVFDNIEGGFDYVEPLVEQESYDWKMDTAPYYGQWRSRIPDGLAPLTTDDSFPTCVAPDIVLLPGAYFFYYFDLEARVDVPGGEQWIYATIDVFDNLAKPQGVNALNGDDISDNQGFGHIQVLPRILLVDDDEASTGSTGDMTSSVVESLIGAGAAIDTMYITGQVTDDGTLRDAPAFDYVQSEVPAPAMKDFDIVIWVTGYVTDPLTNDPVEGPTRFGGNIQEMMRYMDTNKYLLIIGQSPFQGLTDYFVNGLTDDPAPPYVGTMRFDHASSFLRSYLGISKVDNAVDMPLAGQVMRGLDTGPDGITQVAVGQYDIELDDLPMGNGRMQLLTDRTAVVPGFETPVGVTTSAIEEITGDPRWSMIRSMSTPAGIHNAQYRAVSLAWDINQIEYLNEKIDLFAGILGWFDWKINVGRDLAITRMQLFILVETVPGTWTEQPITETNLPKYLDTVYIEATVRNNGPSLESNSVIFYVTGPDGIELPVTPFLIDPRVVPDPLPETFGNPQDISGISGGGGEEIIFKLWLAIGVGRYTFKVVVDPYHLISEVSEENNDISYSTSTVTSFVTQNNILVIDDDFSDNNFHSDGATDIAKGALTIDYSSQGGSPADLIDQVLTDLDYDHEYYIVKNSYETGSWQFDSQMDIMELKRYNSVLWVFGDSGERGLGQRETLTNADIEDIMSYLEADYDEAAFLPPDHNESIMFIGLNFLGDLNDFRNEVVSGAMTVQIFADEYLGVDITSVPNAQTGMAAGGPPNGDFFEDIYTGIEYRDGSELTKFDYRELTLSSGKPIASWDLRPDLYGVEDGTFTIDLIGSQLYRHSPAPDLKYFRTVTQTWQVGRLFDADINPSMEDVESPLHEFIYVTMHWFDTPELRSELLSRDSKITFDNDNPVLGNSYLVKVKIANIGGVAGSGTVRFTDGSTLIKSENIYLEADRSTTLEAIWTPLYAGDRSLKVSIDFYDDDDEVFDILNNGPTQQREIYFFWDDMESGGSNWDHDSIVQMINGEGRLDYMEEPTSSNIENEWEAMQGFHLNNEVENTLVEREYHSSNISYMMHEPNGDVRSPIDVTMVFDTSLSMSGTKLVDAKVAAKTFVDQLTDSDRLALIRMRPLDDVWQVQNLIYMTAANKVTTKALIDGFPATADTPLWDCIGTAVTYAWANRELGRTPAVVALTDGDDCGIGLDWETGSEDYCPGTEPGVTPNLATWGRTDLQGLKWGDPKLDFNNNLGGGRDVRVYHGAYQDINIESPLLPASSQRTGLIYAPIYIFPIALGITPRDATYVNGGSTQPSAVYSKFTTEYYLWQIAQTSSYNGIGRGKYYYAPTSSELQNIYDTVFKEIQDLAAQTTRSETRAGEILYYKLDEAWGSPTASDASVYGHTGTLNFADEWASPGIIGGGLDLWADNLISIPSCPHIDNLNIDTRTFSFWINADNTVSRQIIYRQGDPNNGFTIYFFNNRLYAGWSSTSMGNNFISIPYTDTAAWHLVTFVFNGQGSTETLWLDGVPAASATNGGMVNDNTHGICLFGSGSKNTRYHDSVSNTPYYLDAFVDEFRIYNSALSDQAIKSMYEEPLAGQHGLRAEYYTYAGSTPAYTTFRLIRTEGNIDYNYGAGAPNDCSFTDRFVIRWTGYIKPMYTETYTFYTYTDEGLRLFVDDIRIINNYAAQTATERTGSINLVANEIYPIVLEYFELTGTAVARLSWSSPSQPKEIVPSSVLYLSSYTVGGGGTGGEGGGGGSEALDPNNPWSDGTMTNNVKYLLTKPIDLRNVDHATASFYQKYNLKVGSNGGVVQIGLANSDLAPNGAYTFGYVQPDQPYTGNTLTSAWGTNVDGYGVPMRWAWNGKSAGGTMGWESVSLNLEDYVGHYIKVRFLYIYNHGGTGFGWMIDDFMVKVSSDLGDPQKPASADNWDLISTLDKDNVLTNAWFAGNPSIGGDMKDGIDNSIYTRPIDLTNARSAHIYAEFKFNVQAAAGRPPDGFRVEVSTDNGLMWVPLNLGVRTSWNVSGNENDASDGIPGDGKSFTGLPLGNYWVASNSMARLITNLEGFIGNTVVIRIRVVTNTDGQHYQDPALFKGLYVDNFIVYGESLEGSRGSTAREFDVSGLISQWTVPSSSGMVSDPPERKDQAAVALDDTNTGSEVDRTLAGTTFIASMFLLIAGFFLLGRPLSMRAVKVIQRYLPPISYIDTGGVNARGK